MHVYISVLDDFQTDYQGIMELVGALNARFSDRREIQRRSQKTLSTYALPLLFVTIRPP